MTREASQLGLVHRINHGGGRAGAAERVADVDNVGDAGAFATEFARHRDTEQPLGARGGDRFIRETRIAVDRDSVRRRDRGDFFDTFGQIRRARGDRNIARGVGCRRNVGIDL